LRDNGGGSLDAVNKMVGFLVGPGKVLVSTKGRSDSSELLTPTDVDTTTIKYPKKIILLINNNSASASEIMAGNLKYYKVATLVGIRTFGKATAQNYLGLDSPILLESRLIIGITIARFYLPDGTNITGEGIQPDIDIEQPENFKRFDYLTGKDAQFQEALKILK
jgi:carboxyl-terminal processing protease